MPRISNDHLIQKEPYRSIIVLLTYYRTGLQAKHFMYALSQKRDHSTKTMDYIDKEMKQFFTRETYNLFTGKKEKQFLRELYQEQKTKHVVLHRRLTAGCIKAMVLTHINISTAASFDSENGGVLRKVKKRVIIGIFFLKNFTMIE